MWGFFGAKTRKEEEEEEEEVARRRGSNGLVDMTTLDITYITHRLLGTFFVLFFSNEK